MLRLADVVRRHGPAYLARFGAALLPSHVRALGAIVRCRTGALGGHLALCPRCEEQHLLYHSCRHRACPRCGADATERWLARQRGLLLPVPYFHVVFTVPSELRRLVRSHQKRAAGVLFRAAYDALAELCADRRHLGGRIGALAVLHTWSRTLVYHPHVHLLVPGGALAPDGTWQPARRNRNGPYLVPERALARLFAGKLLAALRRALPSVRIPHLKAGTRWVVEIRAAVQGAHAVLDYLGRYVHRTALAEGAIVDCTDEAVTFRYRDSSSGEARTMRLSPDEFLRRFLQHVLPKGLHRVRSHGLLHSSERGTLRCLQLALAARDDPEEPPPRPRRRRLTCPSCHDAQLVLLRRLTAEQCRACLQALTPRLATARAPPAEIAIRTGGSP